MSSFPKVLFVVVLAGLLSGCGPGVGPEKEPAEPDFETAVGWWPEMPNVWTPLGWKNHLFRFNVFFEGTILAEPYTTSRKQHLKPYEGLGIQVGFLPSVDGELPEQRRIEPYHLTDGNAHRFGDQGWAVTATPVLWTRWRQHSRPLNGVTLKQEAFARISEARDVQSGVEPLFCWIRLSVDERLLMIEQDEVGFLIKLNAPHIGFSMTHYENLRLSPDRSAYPRDLRSKTVGSQNLLVTEPGGKLRLAVLPNGRAKTKWIGRPRGRNDYYLFVSMPAEKGEKVDLLLAMLPLDRPIFEAEMGVGYDRALEASNSYWEKKSETTAELHIPEAEVEEAIEASLKFGEIIAERNPESGEFSVLSGSLVYSALWATPTTMNLHMMLDPFGHHDKVERYLKIFKDHQGTGTPPGDAYGQHPGYLMVPRTLTSIDWLTDHGAILHTLAYHALLTDDQAFLTDYLETILKACEFIQDARRNENHEGVKGVLAPGSSTDRKVPEQALWTDGWNYRGLSTAVRLLERLQHPRTDEFKQEIEEYRRRFVEALREKTAQMPKWTDEGGQTHQLVPTSLSFGGDETHPFYLDTGPLFVVYGGLMKASDEAMQSTRLYFRKGPNWRTFNPLGSFSQPPVLVHEMSSAEPCYSWNVFHSHQLGNRQHFLEGMYSLFAGGLSRKTYIASETRGGISGNIFVNPLAVYLARIAVIDDLLEPGTLHLLRLVPLAWLREGEPAYFRKMATEYGPVSLEFSLDNGGRALRVTVDSTFHHPPAKMILHAPPIKTLEAVVVNGERHSVEPRGQVEL